MSTINKIKLSDIVSMWGTNDERIGVKLQNEEVYFVTEVKTYNQYLLGNFKRGV